MIHFAIAVDQFATMAEVEPNSNTSNGTPPYVSGDQMMHRDRKEQSSLNIVPVNTFVGQTRARGAPDMFAVATLHNKPADTSFSSQSDPFPIGDLSHELLHFQWSTRTVVSSLSFDPINIPEDDIRIQVVTIDFTVSTEGNCPVD